MRRKAWRGWAIPGNAIQGFHEITSNCFPTTKKGLYKMNKAQLIDAIKASAGTPKVAIEEVIDAMTAAITREMAAGGEITLPGIGKLSVTQRAARVGRNPATGEALKIAAKKAVKFGAAKGLKDAINLPATKKGKK